MRKDKASLLAAGLISVCPGFASIAIAHPDSEQTKIVDTESTDLLIFFEESTSEIMAVSSKTGLNWGLAREHYLPVAERLSLDNKL